MFIHVFKIFYAHVIMFRMPAYYARQLTFLSVFVKVLLYKITNISCKRNDITSRLQIYITIPYFLRYEPLNE